MYLPSFSSSYINTQLYYSHFLAGCGDFIQPAQFLILVKLQYLYLDYVQYEFLEGTCKIKQVVCSHHNTTDPIHYHLVRTNWS